MGFPALSLVQPYALGPIETSQGRQSKSVLNVWFTPELFRQVYIGSEAVVRSTAAHRQCSRRPNPLVVRNLATQRSAVPDICRKLGYRGAGFELGVRKAYDQLNRHRNPQIGITIRNVCAICMKCVVKVRCSPFTAATGVRIPLGTPIKTKG